jgi:hypothetical protein
VLPWDARWPTPDALIGPQERPVVDPLWNAGHPIQEIGAIVADAIAMQNRGNSVRFVSMTAFDGKGQSRFRGCLGD